MPQRAGRSHGYLGAREACPRRFLRHECRGIKHLACFPAHSLSKRVRYVSTSCHQFTPFHPELTCLSGQRHRPHRIMSELSTSLLTAHTRVGRPLTWATSRIHLNIMAASGSRPHLERLDTLNLTWDLVAVSGGKGLFLNLSREGLATVVGGPQWF